MTYTDSVEIEVSLDRVSEIFSDPSNRIEWMDGIEAYEAKSGRPGREGFVSEMVFNNSGREMVMTATVTENNLPASFTERIEASHVTIIVESTFMSIAPDRTQYTSKQSYQFKGLINKVMGFVLQRIFKNQTRAHLEGFKRFAEKDDGIKP